MLFGQCRANWKKMTSVQRWFAVHHANSVLPPLCQCWADEQNYVGPRWANGNTVNVGDIGPRGDLNLAQIKKKVILWRHDIGLTIYDSCFLLLLLVYICLSGHHALFFLATFSVLRWASLRRSPSQNTCKNYTGSCSSADTMMCVLFYNEISCPQHSCSQSSQVSN